MSLEDEIIKLREVFQQFCDKFDMTYTMILPQSEKSNRLIPVSQWNKYHDWPTISGMRWLVFNAKYQEMEKVIKRVGRRVLIDEKEFFIWVRKNPTFKFPNQE